MADTALVVVAASCNRLLLRLRPARPALRPAGRTNEDGVAWPRLGPLGPPPLPQRPQLKTTPDNKPISLRVNMAVNWDGMAGS